MKSPSFTPGPWHLRADPYPDGKPYFYIRAGGGHWGPFDNHGFGLSGLMSEANAHLIAAAPDLYEALAELIRCNCDPSGPHSGNIVTGDMRRDAADKARAALAKARGESPPPPAQDFPEK